MRIFNVFKIYFKKWGDEEEMKQGRKKAKKKRRKQKKEGERKSEIKDKAGGRK